MTSRRIYLLGNPVVWWTSTGLTAVSLLSLVYKIMLQARRRFFHLKRKQAVASEAHRIRSADAWLAAGYAVHLLPFVGISRVTFLYHYFPSLIFSILIACVILGSIHRGRKTVFAILAILTLTGFLVIFPVTFGTNHDEWPLWGSIWAEHLVSLLRHR